MAQGKTYYESLTEAAKNPTPELADSTNAFLHRRRQYQARVIADTVNRRGLAPEKDYSALIFKYRELEASLTQMHNDLVIEVEKTGRINATNNANILAAISRVQAATVQAQGNLKGTQVDAIAQRNEFLAEDIKRRGEKTAADIDASPPLMKSVTDLATMISAGKPGNTTGIMQEVTTQVKRLGVSDPTLIVPYMQKVSTITGIPIMNIYANQINPGAGGDTSRYGVPADLVVDSIDAFNAGMDAHKNAREITLQNQAEFVDNNVKFWEGVGYPAGIKIAKDFNDAIKNAPGILDASKTSAFGGTAATTPPKDGATMEEKKAWVDATFQGKAELRDDNMIYETKEGGLGEDGKLTSIKYGVATKLMENPAAYKAMIVNMGPGYIKEMRDHIHDEIKRLETSDDPKYVQLRNKLIQEPSYKEWAVDRGYISLDGKTNMPSKQLFKAFLEEQRSANYANEQLGDLRKMVNIAFNPDVPASDGQRALAIKRVSAMNINKENWKQVLANGGGLPTTNDVDSSPSATMVKGAQGSSSAPVITESAATKGSTEKGIEPPKDTGPPIDLSVLDKDGADPAVASRKPIDFLDKTDVAKGNDPWGYRVFPDGKIHITKKPGDPKVSMNAPLNVKPGTKSYDAIMAQYNEKTNPEGGVSILPESHGDADSVEAAKNVQRGKAIAHSFDVQTEATRQANYALGGPVDATKPEADTGLTDEDVKPGASSEAAPNPEEFNWQKQIESAVGAEESPEGEALIEEGEEKPEIDKESRAKQESSDDTGPSKGMQRVQTAPFDPQKEAKAKAAAMQGAQTIDNAPDSLTDAQKRRRDRLKYLKQEVLGTPLTDGNTNGG